MKNPFCSFQGFKLNSRDNIIDLSNDLFLIHQSFYLFLGNSYHKFKEIDHLNILLDELGLTKRGQIEEYGPLTHGQLWLKDLDVSFEELSLENNKFLIPFQRTCYEAYLDLEKAKGFVAAVESIAEDFINEFSKALDNSGFSNLASVYVHCDPVVGIEVNHSQETESFRDSLYFDNYKKIVIETFNSLQRHMVKI